LASVDLAARASQQPSGSDMGVKRERRSPSGAVALPAEATYEQVMELGVGNAIPKCRKQQPEID
jgi:hypothetical protein